MATVLMTLPAAFTQARRGAILQPCILSIVPACCKDFFVQYDSKSEGHGAVDMISPHGHVGVWGNALLVQEAAVGAAGIVQEHCAVLAPELQHRMQAADGGMLQRHLHPTHGCLHDVGGCGSRQLAWPLRSLSQNLQRAAGLQRAPMLLLAISCRTARPVGFWTVVGCLSEGPGSVALSEMRSIVTQ